MSDNSLQILSLRDNAKDQLMQIKSVEDGISYFNKLKTIDVWVKAEKKDAELQNIIAEQKLRTQRILGTLLKESEKNTGSMGIGKSVVPEENHTPKLSDVGLNKKQSYTFQQIASIPEETFEEFIEEKKAAVNNAVAELTTSGAIRLAKSLQQEKDTQVMRDLRNDLSTEKELKDLAHNINMTYTKDQRRFLITLIKQ